jgi:peptidoglycan L-alanyl-D-glutamate endopeptidase CwlK
MSFRLGKNSIINLTGVDGRLIEIADLAITLSTVDFGIPSTGGLRTTEDQAELFAEGVSKADGVNNKSYHQSGMAVDVFAYVDGKASWDKLDLSLVATAMLQAAAQLGYPLKWGGLWKSWQDYPHFQLGE